MSPSGALSGALVIGEKKSHLPFSNADHHALQALCQQIGLLHDHALLEVEQTEVVIAERTRIARELHDTLAQGFAGIGLHLDLGMRQSAQEQSRWHMEQARQLATESLAAARRSVHDLRTMAGTGTDLGEMVKAMATQLVPKFEVHCTVNTVYTGPMPLDVSQQVFRIAQESITNIIKHSQASRVDVLVRVERHEVVLEVRDNGRGFDASDAVDAKYGLAGMRERARDLKATLDVVSAPGAGTTVRVTAPVAP
jgi:signal transduction histidine kinase